MLKKLIVFSLISSILFACAGHSYDEAEADVDYQIPIPEFTCEKNVKSFLLMTEDSINDEYRALIMDALNEWDTKTGYCLDYRTEYKNMLDEDLDPKNFSNIYKLVIKDPGDKLVGWTTWIISKNSATIYIEPGLSPIDFRTTLLHELGHAFNLKFDGDIHYTGEFKSVMHPAIGNTSKLECPELISFCDAYHCKVECEFEKAAGIHLQSYNSSENICNTTLLTK